MPAAEFGQWAQKFLIDEYDKDSEFGETFFIWSYQMQGKLLNLS